MKSNVTVSIPFPGSELKQEADEEPPRRPNNLPRRPNSLGAGLRGLRRRESGRFDVRVSYGSKRLNVGTFATISDALKARDEALAQLRQISSLSAERAKVVSVPAGMKKSDIAIRDLGIFATPEDALAASLTGLIGAANNARPGKPQLIIQALWIAPPADQPNQEVSHGAA